MNNIGRIDKYCGLYGAMNMNFNSKGTLVSVLIPTYKRSAYITRAIDSVLTQTYQNIEIVVVDDNIHGSDEAIQTQRVLEPYRRAGKIKYLQTPGQLGGGAARNFALKSLTGEYVAFLDDDDKFKPDKIEKQLQFILDNDLDMSYQDVEWHNNATDNLVELRRMDRVKDFSTEGLLRAHTVSTISPTAIYMIKREKLLQTAGFGEVPRGQDTILMYRCIELGMKIGYMPGSYVVQYIHDGERTSNGEKFVQGQRQLYEFICKYKPILNKKECNYVDFRFNAVCAFALARDKRLLEAVPFAAKAFFISPIDCFKEAKRYLGGRKSDQQ